MQMANTKRLMLLLISLVGIFALGVATSFAQEKIKISGKRYGVATKTEVIKVDDTEGNILILGESRGIDVVTGARFISRGFGDYVKGNGTHRGYGKAVTPEGVTFFNTYEGKTITTLSPEGKPITTIEGTFSFTRGTGKWENVHGGGTYKGKVIGEGIYTYDWEGEYYIKKE
jgi:hypothetical protein